MTKSSASSQATNGTKKARGKINVDGKNSYSTRHMQEAKLQINLWGKERDDIQGDQDMITEQSWWEQRPANRDE